MNFCLGRILSKNMLSLLDHQRCLQLNKKNQGNFDSVYQETYIYMSFIRLKEMNEKVQILFQSANAVKLVRR